MHELFIWALGLCLLALLAGSAEAQQAIPGFDSAEAARQQRIGERHFKLIGGVHLKVGDTEIFADEGEAWTDEDRLVATGNVVLAQGVNRIAAERAEFNTKTRRGIFYHATGIASIKPQPQAPRPGAFAPPPVSSVETDVYFYGDTVEKLGPKKYKITNGGFTTCVQPTLRWMLTSKTVVLNLDHYTLLRDAIFSVKGVPMLYTLLLYYPTNKEDLSNGFPLPTYGS